MTISVLFLVGRFLFAVPFVMLGTECLLTADARGLERWWGLVGLIGAVGVVIGVWGDIAALVVGVAVVGGGIVEGRTAEATDATRVRLVGLLGGALVVAALYIAVGSALNLVLTDPVLDLDLR
jgi:hypothetical protein